MLRNAPWLWLTCIVLIGFGCATASPPPPAPSPTSEPSQQPPFPALSAEPQPDTGPASAPQTPLPVMVDPATAPQPKAFDVPRAVAALIDAKDRTPADRALDAGRHPGELLAFYGVKPGMKVAELFVGGGYTAELLARAVGKRGKVYGQNSKFVLDRFAAGPWAERLARPSMKNVVRVDRELDDPLPPDAKDLDIVFSVLIYHDTVWLGTDRAKMNAAILAALKPGGVYAVVDHSGRTGTGVSEVQTLHRIEQSVVTAEIESAGFKQIEEGWFLRNPHDSRDWNDAPTAAKERRGTSDRFVLKFVKPKR
jgi:predicted methyltransferase